MDKLRRVTTDPSGQKEEKLEAHWSHRSIAILKSSQAYVASFSIRSWSYCLGMILAACMCAKSLQSCQMLCDPMDCSPPDLSVHWILQARKLGWVDILGSRGSSQSRDQTCISYVSCGQIFFFSPLAPPGKPNDSWFCPLNSWFTLFSPQVILPSLYRKVPWVCSL